MPSSGSNVKDSEPSASARETDPTNLRPPSDESLSRYESAPNPTTAAKKARERAVSWFSPESLSASLDPRRAIESLAQNASPRMWRDSSHSSHTMGTKHAASSSTVSLSPPLPQEHMLSSSRSFEQIPPANLDANSTGPRPRSSTSTHGMMSLAQQIAADDWRRKTEKQLAQFQHNENSKMGLSPPSSLHTAPRGQADPSHRRYSENGDLVSASRRYPSRKMGTVEPKTLMPGDPKTQPFTTRGQPDPHYRTTNRNSELRREEQRGDYAYHATRDPSENDFLDASDDEDVRDDSMFSDLHQVIKALGARTKMRSTTLPKATELPSAPDTRPHYNAHELSTSASVRKHLGPEEMRTEVDKLPSIPTQKPLILEPIELEGSEPSLRFELEGDLEPSPATKRPLGQRERLAQEVANRASGFYKIQQEWDAQQKFDVPIYQHPPS
ncbi:MAG: hypothetical protein M4579_002134 [Chaenotheca gracillima]|nr:MAG: hypothetical protein M4579_002134 [Chaenotheca gracillima]